jgi:hypothetical protein
VLNSGSKHTIRPYISRPYTLKASYETSIRLRRIFRGISAASIVTLALRRYKSTIIGLISERDPISIADRPLKSVEPLVRGLERIFRAVA